MRGSDEVMNRNFNDDEFKDIMNLFSDMVYKLALNQTKHIVDAEDVYQDVFFKLYQNQKEFQSQEHMKAWLIKVTINTSKKIFTSSWYKKRTSLDENIEFESQEYIDLYNEILALPKKYRTVLHLFYYEGYSINEISSILDLKSSTVKTHLFRARDQLKNKLEGGNYFE